MKPIEMVIVKTRVQLAATRLLLAQRQQLLVSGADGTSYLELKGRSRLE